MSRYFSPLVSDIQVEALDRLVIITWADIVDITTVRYRLYRSGSELFPENLSSADLIGEFSPGVEQAEDVISRVGDYYYAIVTVDQNETELPILVPLRNKTIRAIRIGSEEVQGPFTGVSSLRALAGDGEIDLSFNTVRDIRPAIFRSTGPILNSADLFSSIQVAVLDSGENRYSDTVLSGVPYYYAVLDSDIISDGSYIFAEASGQKLFIPDEDTLSQPVELELEVAIVPPTPAPSPSTEPSLSAIPEGKIASTFLPRINFNQLSDTVLNAAPISIPQSQPIGRQTDNAVRAMLERVALPRERRPMAIILESERNPLRGGITTG